MIKICPKCDKSHEKPGKFCSRICANSRGPRSDHFKSMVSEKLKGTKSNPESIIRAIKTRGQVPFCERPDTICVICNNTTNSKKRMTCSKTCYIELVKKQTRENPKCGGQKHTVRQKITNIRNEVFTSESSYEVSLASILNELNILWIRPEHLWYQDSKGHNRRYYPDFFLVDHNIYLDPKNEYLIKTDIDKIILCSNQNKIFTVILGINHINKNTIKMLVGVEGTAPSLPACKTGTLLLS